MASWTVKQAQHVYATEIIKDRTPIWDLPRTNTEAAQYRKSWTLEQKMRSAETRKKQQAFVDEVSRIIHTTDDDHKMTQPFAKTCIACGIEDWDVVWTHDDDLKTLRLYAGQVDARAE